MKRFRDLLIKIPVTVLEFLTRTEPVQEPDDSIKVSPTELATVIAAVTGSTLADFLSELGRKGQGFAASAEEDMKEAIEQQYAAEKEYDDAIAQAQEKLRNIMKAVNVQRREAKEQSASSTLIENFVRKVGEKTAKQ